MKTTILAIGITAAMATVAPAMAQEATQEPGAMGFFYPDSNYSTGGNGSRATPPPGYYFRPHSIGEQGALPNNRRFGYGGYRY